MIYYGFYMLQGEEGLPDIFGEERAEAPCGCYAVVGKREDNKELAVGSVPCCKNHLLLIGRFVGLLHASLDNPTDRYLIDVCDELLMQAYREHSAIE